MHDGATALAQTLVPRPALTDLLELGASGPLTLLAAPAGSGKTVLVRSWLTGRGRSHPAAWVSVERGERDAQHFWNTVIAELRAATPAAAIEAPAPTPEYDGDAVLTRLLAELAGLERRLVLVLDNVQEIAGAEIVRELGYFLDHLPDELHVVLISRRDPQLGLHRRRLEGRLTELRAEELQFTLEETAELLSGLGIALSEEGVRVLHERTEGWIAGLRLAAISLAGHPDPERFVADFSGSDRTVSEYLLAEVLDSQPADARRLLVRASLLDRVNGELGDLLTGASGSERTLRTLADAGGFVVALDPQRTWFRFHRLFADLLAVELRHSEPDEIGRLHGLAAGWLAERGEVVEAIGHAQAAGEERQAAELLIANYFGLMLDGRQATAHALLEAYAGEPAANSPELAVVMAIDQLVGGSIEQAAAHLALAERQADVVAQERRGRFGLALLVTRLMIARRLGDFRTVLEEVRQPDALTAEPRSRRDLDINNDARALMLMSLGIVEVWSGRLKDGAGHLEEAGDLARQIGRPYLEVGCRAHLAQAKSWESFTLAGVACRETIALAEEHGWGSDPVIAPALVTLATTLVQSGRLEQAEATLARAEEVMRPDLEPAMGFLLYMAYGVARSARGQHAEAIESFRDAERLQLRLVSGSPLALQIQCARLQAMIRSGLAQEAGQALAKMGSAERDSGEVREVIATLDLAGGDARAAAEALAPVLGGSAEIHHPLVLVRCLVLEALIRDTLDESAAGESALERALDLAERDSTVLPFMPPEVRGLLERHPRHRTAHGAFLSEILDMLSGSGPSTAPARPAGPYEELSDAEMRVLRYLPTNLPAAGIAREIYVSTNTVKTHMRHIYAKLGAHSRAEAVERARGLGLLGHSARMR